MSTVSLPVDENILMAAFRAVAERRNAEPADLVAAYGQHFVSAVTLPPAHPPSFDKFSLVDPNVTMTVRSSTSGI